MGMQEPAHLPTHLEQARLEGRGGFWMRKDRVPVVTPIDDVIVGPFELNPWRASHDNHETPRISGFFQQRGSRLCRP
jgi:hypothetical protein